MALESSFFSDVALTSPLTQRDFDQLDDGVSAPKYPTPADVVIYLGLPNAAKKIQALSNPGVDPLLISIVSNVDAWQASTTYADGDILQPPVGNNYKYQVEGNGDSDAAEPVFPTTIGASVVNGGITLRCIDELHQPSEVRLATSQAGLDTAVAGADLNLGTTINGDTAVPVWIRYAQGVHPAGSSVWTDLRLDTVDLAEPLI